MLRIIIFTFILASCSVKLDPEPTTFKHEVTHRIVLEAPVPEFTDECLSLYQNEPEETKQELVDQCVEDKVQEYEDMIKSLIEELETQINEEE